MRLARPEAMSCRAPSRRCQQARRTCVLRAPNTPLSVATEPFRNTNLDTLIVGGSNMIGSLTPCVIKFLRLALRRYRRGASPLIGALLFAAAGVRHRRRPPTPPDRPRGIPARRPRATEGEDRALI